MKHLLRPQAMAFLLCMTLSGVSLMANAELATLVVKKEMQPLERWVDGKVQAVYQSTVSAETSGRVQEILADVGDVVPAGAVILKLVSTEQQQGYNQAAATLAEARAQYDVQEKEFRRIEEVYNRKLIAKTDYDRAEGTLASSKARVESARASVKSAKERLSYTLVKAPFGGTVYARHVELGEAVQPGKPLMSGFDPEAMRVEADLPQSVAKIVAEIRKARVIANGHEAIEAKKLLLFPQADQATGTVTMRLELPKKQTHLHPGKFVKVAVVVGEQERILLPASSIMQRSEVSGVYVQGKAGWQLRQVRLGNHFGENIEVLAGVGVGEKVAVDAIAAGIVAAKANSKTKAQGKANE
jgi:membrane fusion protein, multidrug efflux system